MLHRTEGIPKSILVCLWLNDAQHQFVISWECLFFPKLCEQSANRMIFFFTSSQWKQLLWRVWNKNIFKILHFSNFLTFHNKVLRLHSQEKVSKVILISVYFDFLVDHLRLTTTGHSSVQLQEIKLCEKIMNVTNRPKCNINIYTAVL